MSNDYYFEKWKNLLLRLELTLNIDLEYQEIKAHDKKLCGTVQKLSGMLGCYISIYNEAVECMNQIVQVQKTKYMEDIVQTLSRRIFEIKHQLRKLEQSNYQFMGRGLVNFNLTTMDMEFKDIPKKMIRSPKTQAVIDGIWPKVKEIKENLEEEERQRVIKEEEETAKPFDIELWDEPKPSADSFTQIIEEKLDEKEIEKRAMLNKILAQEKCRQVITQCKKENQNREMWKINLSGNAKPEKPLKIRIRAVVMIQKFARAYFALKRKRIQDCQRDALLGLRICKKSSDDAKIRGEEITDERIALRKKYEEEWKSLYEKRKEKCFNKCDEIQEDYRDEIRSWFHKWHKEAWFFYDIPKPRQGGSTLILQEEVPSPSEWKIQNQQYIDQIKANKGKSAEQQRAEKKAAHKDAQREKREEAQKKRMEQQMLKKIMKNPMMHPGFNYPPSKEVPHIVEAIKKYSKQWNFLDNFETKDVKQKFVKTIDEHNMWAEVKLAIRPNVDEDMKNELKKLKDALKNDYEMLEEPWPTVIMPQKFKNLRKDKPVKDTINDKIVNEMIDLALKGYLKEYKKTKLEDFKGEPNFAGDDMRCTFIQALPNGAETRNVWWEKCTEMIKGFNKILLVGPKASGKTLLTYAMATMNEAILFEITISPEYFLDTSAEELNELAKSIINCAKAVQPVVIYIKYIHRLFYGKKVPPEEPVLDGQLINKCLLKKLTKKFKKNDKVTIIGSCIDPFLTKSNELLKLFPTVVMMPIANYTTTALILREWIINNRMIPPDLDISCLAQVLQGYSYGSLQKMLNNYLNPERIVKMAVFGLYPQEVYDFVLQDKSESRVEYDKYLKWYSEKTNWGRMEKNHLNAQLEFEELANKYAEKTKKKKRGPSAASSAASSMKSFN